MPAITPDTLYRYCSLLYAALLEDSKEVDGATVWEGRFTELFTSLPISNAHYSRVTGALQELGCIETVRRGSRGVLTLIRLHNPPNSDLFEGTVGTVGGGLTQPTATDKLSQRVHNIERRLEGVDIKAYITNTEKRLLELEAQVAGKTTKRRSA